MIKRKVVCIEVIVTKEPIQSIDSFGKNIFITTQSHKMKVYLLMLIMIMLVLCSYFLFQFSTAGTGLKS